MLITYLLIIIMFLALLFRIVFYFLMARRFCTLESLPNMQTAIVFGAGLVRGAYPSTVLKERVESAAELYHAGKIQELLFSGDNRDIFYNEPFAMRSYAESLGIPAERITLDPDGKRTLESCQRARTVFGITEAILITQPFHMPRCLLLAEGCGIHAVAFSSNHRKHDWYDVLLWNFREIFATIRAFFDLLRLLII